MELSIIVPVYNVEEYVLECLNSIRDLSCDYEIIIINDGSTDKSIERINEFTNTFNGNIKVISQNNAGLSSARNIGIQNAKGNYIFFLDSDDFIDKNIFELFLRDVINDNVEVGFANYRYLKNGAIIANKETIYRQQILKKRNDVVDGLTYGDIVFDKFHNFINVEACFLLVKRRVLIDNNISFKTGIYHEDTLFTITCLSYAHRVRYYEYPFYIYRMRDNSIMRTPDVKIINKKFYDKGVIARELFELKKKKNIRKTFLDTLIVDLLIVSAMHLKVNTEEIKTIILNSKKITLKSKIRVALFKILSLSYS